MRSFVAFFYDAKLFSLQLDCQNKIPSESWNHKNQENLKEYFIPINFLCNVHVKNISLSMSIMLLASSYFSF